MRCFPIIPNSTAFPPTPKDWTRPCSQAFEHAYSPRNYVNCSIGDGQDSTRQLPCQLLRTYNLSKQASNDAFDAGVKLGLCDRLPRSLRCTMNASTVASPPLSKS